MANTAPVLIPSASLSTVFAEDGRLEVGFGNPATDDTANAVAPSPDGRLIVAGVAGDDVALVRLLSDGSLDQSFGTSGRVITHLSGVDKAFALAVQADGRIVVAGATDSASNLALLRYTADGNLDTSFGNGGKVLHSLAPSTTAENFTKVLLQPDGTIIAAGVSGATYLIERYTAHGVLDNEFSVDGREQAYFSGSLRSEIQAIALQDDGKLLAAGRVRVSSGQYDFAVARYNHDGTLDTSFNGTGQKVWHQSAYDSLGDIQVQRDGKIVLAGRWGASSSSGDGVLIRLNVDGSMDSSFNGNGSASFHLGGDDRFDTLDILANGQILTAGESDDAALIVRFNASGSIDTGFGNNGAMTTEFGSSGSRILDSVLTQQGRWVGVGQSYNFDTIPEGYDFAVLQLGANLPVQYARAYLGTKRPADSPPDLVSYQIPSGAFHDADGDALVYSASLTDGRPLPDWLNFDTATRTLSGKPSVSDFGSHRILITASDGQAQLSEQIRVQIDTDFIDGVQSIDDRLNIDSAPGTPQLVTYSFMATNSAATKSVETNTFAPMTTDERAAVRAILSSYAAVSGLTFVELDEANGQTGILRYGTYDDSTISATGYARGNSGGSDIWMNRSYIASHGTVAAGSRPYGTMTHETGHALGLKHPGIDPGDSPPFVDADYGLEDSRTNSIMSYVYREDAVVDIVWEGDSGSYVQVYPSTPMLWDVAAIQYLYGANTTHRNGDDVYAFDPAKPFFSNLWDADGEDTIDISLYSHDSVVSLIPGTFSSLHTMAAQGNARDYWGERNLSISYNAIIEHAIGGAGDDSLTGNDAANHLQGAAGNDTLQGGVGDDTLEGGDGNDTAVFSGPHSAFTAQWDADNNWLLLSEADHGTDRIVGVETFRFDDATLLLSDMQAGVHTNDPQDPPPPHPTVHGLSVEGSALTLTLSQALKGTVPEPGRFDVRVEGVVRAVSSATVDGAGKTVRLQLASAVTKGQTVTLSYTDKTTSNDAAGVIEDMAGFDLDSFTAQAVSNVTPDATSPTTPVPVSSVLAAEQYFIYELNRARHDPGAYQIERGVSVNLASVTPRPPVAVNAALSEASGYKAGDFAARNYFSHTAPGLNPGDPVETPNELARRFGYALPASIPEVGNQIESIAMGALDADGALKALIESSGHRDHLLSIPDYFRPAREVGIGYSSAGLLRYWAVHIAPSKEPLTFLTGVVFADGDGDTRFDADEGLGSVTVTATGPTGTFTASSLTAGGWTLAVPTGDYIVTASGGGFSGTGSVAVTVGADSVAVDFISGSRSGWIDFEQFVNSAPTLEASPRSLPPVVTSNTSTPGVPASDLLVAAFADADPLASPGIAITAASAGTASGAWSYSIDGGKSWMPFGMPSASAALLLRGPDLVRFVATPGSPPGTASISYRAWDQTTGVAGGTADASATGGSTAFSTGTAAATIATIAVNTAPVLAATGGGRLAAVVEDSANPAGTAVAVIVDSSLIDEDPGTPPGIAITGSTGQTDGVWEFSMNDGAIWQALGTASEASALTLQASHQVRFRPAADFNGAATISYRAWDQSTGTAGARFDLSGAGGVGGSTAFSETSRTASITVSPENDAPEYLPGQSALRLRPVAARKNFDFTGTTIADLLGNAVFDVDGAANLGIALIGLEAGGSWYWNTGENSWSSADVSPQWATLLRSTDRLGYAPQSGFSGEVTFTFRLWDQSTGTAGSNEANLSNPNLSTGGTNAFGSDTLTGRVFVGEAGAAPTASFGTPDRTADRQQAITSIPIGFSEEVDGFDIGDMTLSRDGSPVSLAGAELTGSGMSFVLGKLSEATARVGSYALTLTVAGSGIADSTGNRLATNTTTLFTVGAETVVPEVPTILSVGGPDSIVSPAANDNLIVGTASAGSTVTLRSGTSILGTAVASVSGAFSYALTTANLTTLAQGTGQSITATVSDPAGNTSAASAAFPFAIQLDLKHPLTAVPDSFAVLEDSTSNALDLLSNDLDESGTTLSLASIAGVTLSPGSAQTITVNHGTVNASASGAITFTPAADYHGLVSFGYAVTNGAGATATGTVTGTVAPTEDEAVGTLVVSGNAEPGRSITALLSSASDPDGPITRIAYRWQQNAGNTDAPVWTDMDGASTASLSIGRDESWVGRQVRVLATTTDALGGTTEFAGNAVRVVDASTSPTGPAIRSSRELVFAQAIDTWIDINSPNTAYGGSASLDIDRSSSNAPKEQTLIRFTDLFGSEKGQIRPDDTIISASLRLASEGYSGNGLAAYRMLQAWSDTATWASLANGVQTDGVEAMATADATHDAYGSWTDVSVDITTSLKAWQAAPSSNLGWMISSTDSTGGRFGASEGESGPILEVTVQRVAALVSVTASDPFAFEGASTGAFTVSRKGTVGDLVVPYVIRGSATTGSDFAPLSGSFTIPDGRTSSTITLVPLEDDLAEGPETVTLELTDSSAIEPDLGQATVTIRDRFASKDGEVVPLDETFELHSLPGARHRIYLDFLGSNRSWGHWNNGSPVHTPAYDTDGDPTTFSDAERVLIQRTWAEMAEDFRPFDIDVTTAAPLDGQLVKTDATDREWGIRAIFGDPSNWDPGATGKAVLGSFTAEIETPAWIQTTSEQMAVFGTHEVGHALGLEHDGRGSTEYYEGHGSGKTTWGPLMGGAVAGQISQWSDGDYPDATNPEDDLQIITSQNGFGYRADDHADDPANATPLITIGKDHRFQTLEGVIERNTDIDWFSFEVGDGEFEFFVDPMREFANLDVKLSLYDGNRVSLASASPVNQLSASLTSTLAAGPYYLRVEGDGNPDPQSDGYDDYGSLGFYTVRVEPAATTLNFRQGVNGYNGTVDTYIGRDFTSATGNESSLMIDGIYSKYPVSTLLRFEDLFGAEQGSIPAGALIQSATLELNLTRTGDAFAVHRLLRDWSEAATYDSLVDGIAADDLEATSGVIARFDDGAPGWHAFDITSALKAWIADPAENHGLLLRPVEGGTHRSDIASSESADAPRLTVRYLPTEALPLTGSLSGWIEHWRDSSPLDAVMLSLTDASAEIERNSVSGMNGQFTFAALDPGAYTVRAERDGSDSLASINSADVLAALKLASGRNPSPDPDGPGPLKALPVSPGQWVAADINANGQVDGTDAQALLTVVGSGTAGSATLPEWVFVDAQAALSSFSALRVDLPDLSAEVIAGATQQIRLVGILRGDVDGSWAVLNV